jgi:hypothetical protein
MTECDRQWMADWFEQKIKYVQSIVNCDYENFRRCTYAKLTKLSDEVRAKLLDC